MLSESWRRACKWVAIQDLNKTVTRETLQSERRFTRLAQKRTNQVGWQLSPIHYSIPSEWGGVSRPVESSGQRISRLVQGMHQISPEGVSWYNMMIIFLATGSKISSQHQISYSYPAPRIKIQKLWWVYLRCKAGTNVSTRRRHVNL